MQAKGIFAKQVGDEEVTGMLPEMRPLTASRPISTQTNSSGFVAPTSEESVGHISLNYGLRSQVQG